jgi:epoxyqueuosine reductase
MDHAMDHAMDLATIVAALGDGAARIGVTDLSPFPEVRDGMRQRIESGMSGRLGFTYRDPATATTPASSWPWGRSLIVAAVPYVAEGDGLLPVGEDRSVARFADGDRYGEVRGVLAVVEGVLRGEGWRTEAVWDDHRLVDRAAAVRSGVAWWGKSTMALTPGAGPWFLIGSVVTDAPITPTPPMERGCGTCVACIPACPTGAIVAPGLLDARRCLSAVLQARGPIPPELRESIGGRIYGCDDCLTACPPGGREVAGLGSAPTIDPRDVLRMDDEEIDRRFAHWYVPGRHVRFVRRNALVAVGNAASSDDLGLLASYVSDPDPLLRSHAAWALGRLGDAAALDLLRRAADAEVDPEVVAEIEASILRSPDDP